jgi:hypothetical protein
MPKRTYGNSNISPYKKYNLPKKSSKRNPKKKKPIKIFIITL